MTAVGPRNASRESLRKRKTRAHSLRRTGSGGGPSPEHFGDWNRNRDVHPPSHFRMRALRELWSGRLSSKRVVLGESLSR